MTDRITITVPMCYMPLDGQWQIVLSGTVIDVPSAIPYAGACTLLSPAEAPGKVASHGKPTPVRGVRTGQ